MDTQDTNHNGKTVIVQDLTHEIRESMRKDILSKLFDKNSSLSTGIDAEILRMVLVEDKKLSEVGEKLNLAPLEISQSFYRALQRVNLRYATFNKQVENAIDLQGEVLFLKSKLKDYERKENRILGLPPETREILFKNIRHMGFSSRVWNILHAYDIETVADLARLTKWEFSRFKNAGKISLKEVSDFLSSKGLSWGMNI